VVHAVFVFFAVIAVVSAILCITQRQPVGAIMWLIVTMLSLAGIFTLLGGLFAGVMQVLVYAGAILVLFMFFVMLLQLRHKETDIRGPLGWVLAVGIAAALLSPLVPLRGYTAGRVAEELTRHAEVANPAYVLPQAAEVVRSTEASGAVGAVSAAMFGTRPDQIGWLVPFELTSVLLLAAMVGAVVLAKRRL
jgi:NADH-quinone oxidoreductase subunit J